MRRSATHLQQENEQSVRIRGDFKIPAVRAPSKSSSRSRSRRRGGAILNIHQVRWPTSNAKRSQNENTDGMCLFTGKSCRDNRALLGAEVICICWPPRNRQLRDPVGSDSGGIRPSGFPGSFLEFGDSGADVGAAPVGGASSRKEKGPR